MPDLITPNATTPPPRHPAARYSWKDHADGQLWQWRDGPEGESPAVARKAADRIRMAAFQWAKRRGGRIETRMVDHGRQLWIAIHLPADK